jgi:hypothetical protein
MFQDNEKHFAQVLGVASGSLQQTWSCTWDNACDFNLARWFLFLCKNEAMN